MNNKIDYNWVIEIQDETIEEAIQKLSQYNKEYILKFEEDDWGWSSHIEETDEEKLKQKEREQAISYLVDEIEDSKRYIKSLEELKILKS